MTAETNGVEIFFNQTRLSKLGRASVLNLLDSGGDEKDNTTNLHVHLKHKHSTQFSQLRKKLHLETQSLGPDSRH